MFEKKDSLKLKNCEMADTSVWFLKCPPPVAGKKKKEKRYICLKNWRVGLKSVGDHAVLWNDLFLGKF